MVLSLRSPRQPSLCPCEVAIELRESDRLKPEGMTFFVSEQLKPMHRSTANLALKKYRELANLNLSVAVPPHMLRYACGYALADQSADTRLIQDYIQYTVRHTVSNPARFEKLWR